MVAPQQTEECSGATAMQLQPQQCANTPMQRQHIAIEAVQEIAAEAQTPLQEPSSALPAASFAMQISAAASSAAQKMHSIATHATSWWQRRRRNHTENANRMTETAANVDGPGQIGNRDIIRIVVVLAARRDISYPDRQTVSPTPIRIVPHSSYSPLLPFILSTLNKRF